MSGIQGLQRNEDRQTGGHGGHEAENNAMMRLGGHRSEEGNSLDSTPRPKGRPGRPPGSKNKPKSSDLVATPENVMKPYILVVQAGRDIIQCLTQFCHRHQIALHIIMAKGQVTNMTLQSPQLPIPGTLEIIFLNGYCTGQGCTLSIMASDRQLQVMQGCVRERLIAATDVTITAASFMNATFFKLDGNGEEEVGAVRGSGNVYAHSLPQSSSPTPTPTRPLVNEYSPSLGSTMYTPSPSSINSHSQLREWQRERGGENLDGRHGRHHVINSSPLMGKDQLKRS